LVKPLKNSDIGSEESTVLGVILLLQLVFVSAVLLLLASCVYGQRNYHKYEIADLAAVDPSNWHGKFLTHIEISGWITYMAKEGDGDIHLRLCDSADAPKLMDHKHCMVAEIAPTLQPKGYFKPKKGMHITVRGIGRYDAENPGHHWWECHPVEQIELVSP
jgi:hypothetical protein